MLLHSVKHAASVMWAILQSNECYPYGKPLIVSLIGNDVGPSKHFWEL